MMMVDNKYEFGDVVYLKTDPDQFARVVTELIVCDSRVLYTLSLGTINSNHYDFEISTEKDLINVI